MTVTFQHRFGQRIGDLLALHMTHEKIARRLGMSVANVGKIARQLGLALPTSADDTPPGFEQKNLRRCPDCGGLVYLWPCLTCQIPKEEA